MKVIKGIVGVIGVMLFLMGVIYGEMLGIYLSSAAIFLMIYAFNIQKWIGKKIKIELNLPSEIFLIGSLVFIYLSLYENDITFYNLLTAISCTILFWLFIYYLNIPENRLNIEENIIKKKVKYVNYKIPSKSFLNQIKISYEKEEYKELIDDFFKVFKLKIKYIDDIQNSWILTYKYEITTGIRIDDILELIPDLELKLKTKVEIIISEIESNMIYIKILRNRISDYGLINCLVKKKENIFIPLGEDDEGNKISINLEDNSPLLIMGELGVGKTNFLNVIITNVLLNYNPQEIGLILIDKKQTGLDIYNNIPHLVLPLLNDPDRVLDYLDSINNEIDRRINNKGDNSKIIVIIDEIFDINAEDNELREKLEKIITLGQSNNIYLVLSSSIMYKTPLMEYLDMKINNKIYFYGKNVQEYNSYQSDMIVQRGIINYKINNMKKRIRTPKIDAQEIRKIVNDAKGLN